MQLRQTRRLPGRYREDDVPELPPNPTQVEPTIPFDPTLRPAVFPTLDLDQFPPDQLQDNSQAKATTSNPERPAIVFRDPRIIREDPRTIRQFAMAQNIDDPGQFVPRIGEEPENQSYARLPAEAMHVEWKDLPNAIKIILIREMCQDMQFLAIVEFFQLDDSDLDQFMEMLASEVALFDNEMSRLDGILQRQDDLVRAGLPDQAKKEWDEFMVQETTDNDRPQFALYSVKPEDVGRGKCFLLDFRTREEYHDFDHNTASEGDLEAMNCIPKFATVHAAVTRLDDYIGTAVHCDDPVFEKALLKDYQEAVQYIKEAEMIENALTASIESGSHGHEGQGASDNNATTPTQASDVVSNNGEADDETTPPKKKATKSTKNTKTRASTELVNKKLSPKKATPKTKNKNKPAPASLPPSSLRNVTNSEDLNTPNQPRAPSTKMLTAKSSASIEQALTNAVAAELVENLLGF